jgi:two-component system CheB/CheR fusion protein
VLARYAPSGVIVDENLTILQFRGKTSHYLEPAPGVASFDLLKMVREGLMVELRAAFADARAQRVAVRRENVHFLDRGQRRTVNLDIVPIRSPSAAVPRCFLVLFEDVSPVGAKPALEPTSAADESQRDDGDGCVTALRQELDATRQYLQSLLEEQDATSEELRSANEEILSSNEELQSTNEELQTAKEEMQSANEELATVNDELKQRNLDLGKVNDDLVNLLAGVNIPIIMVGRDLHIRRFTPQAAKLLNLIPTDIGRPISHIRPNIAVPDLEQVIGEVIETLSPRELDVQDKDGHWYVLRVRPYITTENKIDGATIAAVDVDALRRGLDQAKRSRDYADAIVEQVWEPLLVLDEDLRVERANQAFYQAFRTTPEETGKRYFYEIGAGQWDNPRVRRLLGEVIPKGSALSDFELEVDLAAQGRRVFLIKAHRIPGEDDRPPKALVAMEDITERKQQVEHARILAEEQAARAHAELTSRLKDEFLAMLAHELRNPLAPVRSAVDYLLERLSDDPEVRQTLAVMDRQVSHMSALLDDLLDMARVTRGEVRLRPEPLDLGAAIQQALETTRAADRHGHKFEPTLPSTPVWVRADPIRIEQTLTNLISNAIKYTPPGGHIQVELEREGPEAVVRVRDNGIGIAPESLPRIFDLFMQSGRGRDRTPGGLGIGLTLVRSLVTMHGGSVHAASSGLGKGSEFVVRLPALPEGELILPTAPPEAPAEVPPRRILLVDDQPDVGEMVGRLLTRHGHEVKVARSGDEALQTIRDFVPEVAIIDIGLPGMDGYELAQHLRAKRKLASCTLIAMTGYGEEDDHRGRAAGFDAYLIKPVKEADLRRALASSRG